MHFDGQDLGICLWGLLGGLIRALDGVVRGNTTPTLVALLSNILVAGFCGFIASKIAVHFDADWGMVAAGIGGYLGTTMFDIAIGIMQQGGRR